MEGPLLPGGSGGEEPPEDPQLALWAQKAADDYELSMRAFEDNTGDRGRSYRKRRHRFSEYTAKNCEESWAGRPRG